jgi:cell division protein FtsW
MSKLWTSIKESEGHVRVLAIIVLAGLLFGFIMTNEASTAYEAIAGNSVTKTLVKNALQVLFGCICFWIVLRWPMRFIRLIAVPSLVVSLLLLTYVLTLSGSYGGQRWISLGYFTIQPSEIFKLVSILYLAAFLPWVKQSKSSDWMALVIIAPLLVGVGLVVKGHDLGTTAIIVSIFAVAMFSAEISMKVIAWTFLPVLGIGIVLTEVWGYAQHRLQAYFGGGNADVRRQITESLNALGSGGVPGLGLGHSRSIWGVLTNAHSDFIFSVIGEELGFLGVVTVIIAFGALCYCGFRVASLAQDPGSKLMATCITWYLVLQAAINIGSVSASIPVVGVPLPFLSAGGSSLIVTMLSMGFLINIGLHRGLHESADFKYDQLPLQRFLENGNVAEWFRGR